MCAVVRRRAGEEISPGGADEDQDGGGGYGDGPGAVGANDDGIGYERAVGCGEKTEAVASGDGGYLEESEIAAGRVACEIPGGAENYQSRADEFGGDPQEGSGGAGPRLAFAGGERDSERNP